MALWERFNPGFLAGGGFSQNILPLPDFFYMLSNLGGLRYSNWQGYIEYIAKLKT
jgi:hypothetical protein